MCWDIFKQAFCLLHSFNVLLDCNLFEINISYGLGDIKAINLLCQQPPAWLIVTLMLQDTGESVS